MSEERAESGQIQAIGDDTREEKYTFRPTIGRAVSVIDL